MKQAQVRKGRVGARKVAEVGRHAVGEEKTSGR